jgi:hypothetical protein
VWGAAGENQLETDRIDRYITETMRSKSCRKRREITENDDVENGQQRKKPKTIEW